jgi:hypothetical protein
VSGTRKADTKKKKSVGSKILHRERKYDRYKVVERERKKEKFVLETLPDSKATFRRNLLTPISRPV